MCRNNSNCNKFIRCFMKQLFNSYPILGPVLGDMSYTFVFIEVVIESKKELAVSPQKMNDSKI